MSNNRLRMLNIWLNNKSNNSGGSCSGSQKQQKRPDFVQNMLQNASFEALNFIIPQESMPIPPPPPAPLEHIRGWLFIKSRVLYKDKSYLSRLSQMAFFIVAQGTPTHGSRCPVGGAGWTYEKKKLKSDFYLKWEIKFKLFYARMLPFSTAVICHTKNNSVPFWLERGLKNGKTGSRCPTLPY